MHASPHKRFETWQPTVPKCCAGQIGRGPCIRSMRPFQSPHALSLWAVSLAFTSRHGVRPMSRRSSVFETFRELVFRCAIRMRQKSPRTTFETLKLPPRRRPPRKSRHTHPTFRCGRPIWRPTPAYQNRFDADVGVFTRKPRNRHGKNDAIESTSGRSPESNASPLIRANALMRARTVQTYSGP